MDEPAYDKHSIAKRSAYRKARRGFKITQGKGFHITFVNGYTVSVQFGYGSMCNNANPVNPFERMFSVDVNQESPDAEVAVLSKTGKLMILAEFDNDTIGRHYTPEMVLTLLNKVSKFS